MRSILAICAIGLLAGCGGDAEQPAGTGGSTGPGGEGGMGGGGGAEPLCDPGERELDDGSCQPAGVSDCGEGFMSDGASGCDPIYPADVCPAGLMALPGEASCREVAPCGAGPWGDIPVEADTQYVDQSYTVGDSDGTAAKPWPTIPEGVAAAASGAIVAIAEGTYPGVVLINERPVRLWGRCPSLVSLVGGNAFVVQVGDSDTSQGSTDGTELRDLGITAGGSLAVVVSDTQDVLVDRVWIHDTGALGLGLVDLWGPVSGTVRGSLVENTPDVGIFVQASDMIIESTVVRGTQAGSLGDGRGIGFEPSMAGASLAQVSHVVVEHTRGGGIGALGVDAVIERSYVLDVAETDLPAAAGTLGRGLFSESVSGASTTFDVRQTVVDRATDAGVLVRGTTAQLEQLTVRDTQPEASTQEFGHGVIAQFGPDGPATLTLVESTLADNRDAGMSLVGAEASVDSVLIRDTLPRASDGWRGIGINHSFVVDGGMIVDTPRTTATIRWSVIRDSRGGGLTVAGMDAVLEACLVASVLEAEPIGFGDGVQLVSVPSVEPTTLAVIGSEIRDSARAGITSFGSTATLEGSTLGCNPVHLNAESSYPSELGLIELPFVFEDRGGNRCGCDGVDEDCKVLSTGLTPPVAP